MSGDKPPCAKKAKMDDDYDADPEPNTIVLSTKSMREAVALTLFQVRKLAKAALSEKVQKDVLVNSVAEIRAQKHESLPTDPKALKEALHKLTDEVVDNRTAAIDDLRREIAACNVAIKRIKAFFPNKQIVQCQQDGTGSTRIQFMFQDSAQAPASARASAPASSSARASAPASAPAPAPAPASADSGSEPEDTQ